MGNQSRALAWFEFKRTPHRKTENKVHFYLTPKFGLDLLGAIPKLWEPTRYPTQTHFRGEQGLAAKRASACHSLVFGLPKPSRKNNGSRFQHTAQHWATVGSPWWTPFGPSDGGRTPWWRRPGARATPAPFEAPPPGALAKPPAGPASAECRGPSS